MADYVCEIPRAGQGHDGAIIVGLKEVNGAFDIWSVAHPEYKKEILAIALMAISSNKRVVVTFPDTPNPPAPWAIFTRLTVERGW